MFGWAIAFLVIAVGAMLLGFTGIAAGAASLAKLVFLVTIIAVVIAGLVAAASRRGS